MRTTVKTKFRKSTVNGKAGTVFFQVIYNRQMARINTDFHLLPCDWEKVCSKTCLNDDHLTSICEKIENEKMAAYIIVKGCEESGETYSAKTIVTLFKTNRTNEQTSVIKSKESEMNGNDTSFLELIRNRIDILKAAKRFGTAANCNSALKSFTSFANGRNITINMITQEFMEEYNAWLRNRNLKRNTISFYMRELRAVYNIAVSKGLTSQTYPFKKVFTGLDKTRKRAVDEDVISEIASLDLKDNQTLQQARDFFLLSYSLCGMPFVDMVYLKPKDIKDGVVSYERRKTGEPISFKLPQLAETIIKGTRKRIRRIFFPSSLPPKLTRLTSNTVRISLSTIEIYKQFPSYCKTKFI